MHIIKRIIFKIFREMFRYVNAIFLFRSVDRSKLESDAYDRRDFTEEVLDMDFPNTLEPEDEELSSSSLYDPNHYIDPNFSEMFGGIKVSKDPAHWRDAYPDLDKNDEDDISEYEHLLIKSNRNKTKRPIKT